MRGIHSAYRRSFGVNLEREARKQEAAAFGKEGYRNAMKSMNVASWIAIGIGIGAAIGAATEQMGLWVAIGVLIGVGMYATQVLWEKSTARDE